MLQEVKSLSSRRKKLFEWNRDTRMIKFVVKNKIYECELGTDNLFNCLSEKTKNTQRKKKTK